VTGDLGYFIIIKAETSGTVVKWVSLDHGLKLFPTDQLKDTHSAVVISLQEGAYRLLAYTSDAAGPSDPAIVKIVIGPPPGPPVPPGPGPGPAPVPADELFNLLQAAYTADTDPAKAKYLAALAEIYSVVSTSTVQDPSLKTLGDLFTKILNARRGFVPDSAFVAERRVIDTYFSSHLSKDPLQPLDAATQATLTREFRKVSDYLKAVR